MSKFSQTKTNSFVLYSDPGKSSRSDWIRIPQYCCQLFVRVGHSVLLRLACNVLLHSSIKILIVIVPDPKNLVCYHQVLAIWGLILPVDFFHEQWEVLGVVADLQISLSGTATVSILKKLIFELNRIVFGFEY